MKYRYLGSTGLSVSELCFGAMTFGEKGAFLGAPGRNWSEFGVVPEQTAYDLVYKALDAGINFFDTADCYKNGQGEELLGNALKGKRQQVIIGTKGRWQTDPNPNALGASRYHIINAVEASLQRLKTDYIDIYHLHGFDPRTALEDTLRTLDTLIRAGKIRYIGVSNETAFGVMRYLHLADKHDLPRIVTIQNPYSMLNRSYEVGLAEVTQYEEVELLAYSCLGFGTLTGKYLNGAKPAGARNTLFSRFTRYSGEQTQKAVAAYVDIAKRHGLDPAQMALAFVRRQPFVASTLLGATTMEQLKTNIESFHLNLSEEVLAEIEAVHQVYTYPAP